MSEFSIRYKGNSKRLYNLYHHCKIPLNMACNMKKYILENN